ncbi:hypothetical protein ACJ41O_009959 [Fusarium nematophilum]
MCTRTETREECCRCGYTSATQGPIESCDLRSREPLDARASGFGGRCYGVATTSYTESIICRHCAILEEEEEERRRHQARRDGHDNGGF